MKIVGKRRKLSFRVFLQYQFKNNKITPQIWSVLEYSVSQSLVVKHECWDIWIQIQLLIVGVHAET